MEQQYSEYVRRLSTFQIIESKVRSYQEQLLKAAQELEGQREQFNALQQ